MPLEARSEDGGKDRAAARTHTAICWVDGVIGLGALGIHKLAPDEELVGHLKSQLVHCPFHLGRKAQSQRVSHTGICDKHMPRDTQRDVHATQRLRLQGLS